MEIWCNKVNQNFYGLDSSYTENTKSISFSSGRKITYLKNTTPKKKYALLLSVDDLKKIEGKTEFEWFLDWYENTILSGTEEFLLNDVITHKGLKSYVLSSIPTWKGQAIKQISLTIEEV